MRVALKASEQLGDDVAVDQFHHLEATGGMGQSVFEPTTGQVEDGFMM